MDNLEARAVILGGLFSLVGVILTIRIQDDPARYRKYAGGAWGSWYSVNMT